MADKKRILLVLPTLAGGGGERVVLSILRLLDRSKFELALAVFEYCGELKKHVPADVEVHPMPGTLGLRKFFKGRAQWRQLIEQWKPDLIHAHLNIANRALCRYLRGMNFSAKLVLSEHSIVGKMIQSQSSSLLRAFIAYETRRCYRIADEVWAVSNAVKEDLIRLGVTNEIRTVLTPVQLPSIKRNNVTDEGQGDVMSVVAVGRLVPEKGFPVILETIKKILEMHPVYLTVVGDGPLKNELLVLAKQLDLEQHVSFLGYVENVWDELLKHQFFLAMPRYEALGISHLEAMHAGLPVVSTASSLGPKEYIEHGINGFLVDSDDSAKAAEYIVKLAKDKKQHRDCVTAGRETATRYDEAEVVKGYEEGYFSLMEGNV